MSTFLAGLAGASAARLEQGADSARHAGEMAEIAADNATAAANNAARLSKDAFDAAIQSAANGKMAVEEGRVQSQFIVDLVRESHTENAASIAALTDLVKADIQQNKGISARLERIEQHLNANIVKPE
jgi:Arc/MetJ-type ribon-helix-helix transcriptional regulator